MASESVGSLATPAPSPPSSPPVGGIATPTMPNIQRSPIPLTPGERGNCFKCNQEGHWARNCPMKQGIPSPPSSPGPASGVLEFPDYRCSCGTTVSPKQSHTKNNPNRWFYSCRKCAFWKWCDKVVGPGQMHGSANPVSPTRNHNCGTPKTPDTDMKHLYGVSMNLEHAFDASAGASPSPSPGRRQPVPGSGTCPAMCRCGVLCQVLTSKTSRNPNRRFCKCAKQEPEGCRFFEWCDEHVRKTDGTTPVRLENALGTSSPRSGRASLNDRIINTANLPSRQDCGKIPLEVDQTHGVSSVSCPECACGAGKCCVSEVTEGEYVGRSYYSCPIKKGQGACNFFKWVESPANPQETKNNIVDQNDIPSFELIPNIQSPQKKDPSAIIINIKGPSLSPNKGAVKAGACFRCGQDGHWASECRVSQRAKYS